MEGNLLFFSMEFRVENIGRKVNQEILEVVTGIGGGFSFRMRWKINSRGTKSRAKVKLVSFFFPPLPAVPRVDAVVGD